MQNYQWPSESLTKIKGLLVQHGPCRLEISILIIFHPCSLLTKLSFCYPAVLLAVILNSRFSLIKQKQKIRQFSFNLKNKDLNTLTNKSEALTLTV